MCYASFSWNHTCFDPSIALQLACPLENLGTKLLLASPEHPLLFGTSSNTKHDYPRHDDRSSKNLELTFLNWTAILWFRHCPQISCGFPIFLYQPTKLRSQKSKATSFLPDFCGLSTSLKPRGSSESLKMLVDFRSFDWIASYSLSLEGPYLKIGLDD